MRAKALASGADECYVEDLREEFVESFIYPDAPRRRDLQSQVPPRHIDGAPAHRAAPGRGRAARRRRRARARMHGEGQRPGSLRADLRHVRAGSSGDRAVARVGHSKPRGRDRLRGGARHSHRRHAAEDLLARCEPLAPLARGRRSSRTRTPRRRTICSCSPTR